MPPFLSNANRQRGLSLVDTAMALTVAALATALLMQMVADSTAQIRALATADRMTEVIEATRDYARVHHAQLAANAGPYSANGGSGTLVIPVGKTSPTAPVPSGPAPVLPSVQGGGFLPSGFVDTNPYGQRHAVLVREVAENRLEIMVTTVGGRMIADADLGRIASKIGSEGGFVMSAPISEDMADEVQGAYGGWRVPISDWRASSPALGDVGPVSGHAVAMVGVENGTVLNDYLYRYDIGVPEANRMHAPIDMNGNDLENVDTLTAVADIIRIEQDLLVARDANVTRDLDVGQDVTVGRDMSAVRDVAAERNLSAGQDVSADRDVRANRDLTAARNLAVSGASTLAATNVQTLRADGLVTAQSGLQINRTETAGAACPTIGLVARQSNGILMNCANTASGRRWQAIGSGSITGMGLTIRICVDDSDNSQVRCNQYCRPIFGTTCTNYNQVVTCQSGQMHAGRISGSDIGGRTSYTDLNVCIL